MVPSNAAPHQSLFLAFNPSTLLSDLTPQRQIRSRALLLRETGLLVFLEAFNMWKNEVFEEGCTCSTLESSLLNRLSHASCTCPELGLVVRHTLIVCKCQSVSRFQYHWAFFMKAWIMPHTVLTPGRFGYEDSLKELLLMVWICAQVLPIRICSQRLYFGKWLTEVIWNCILLDLAQLCPLNTYS